MPSRERKQVYFKKMTELLDTYTKIMVVHADHVGSQQFHNIRSGLRGVAEVLMGKNTLMRKVINNFLSENPDHPIENVLPYVKGNIGLIFTNSDFSEVRKAIDDNRVPAAARANVIAECDVVVPPGPTGCDPGQTSWFQALNVPTKISRGQIEIVSELKIVSKGDKVSASEAALLQKLNIKPFTYGLVLKQVYDNGKVFSAAVLDITSEDLEQKFITSLRRAAAVSIATGIPTIASVPHSVGNAMKRLIAICASSGYSFPQMKEWDDLFNMDPEELAKLQAASAAAGGGGAAEEAKQEEEEEEVDVGGGNLFGDEEDAY
jgi:large subunit ribosomal protein LP0